MRIGFTAVALGIVVLPLGAQPDTKPAPVLEIIREAIKEGRSAAHEKVEADYAAAFRKVNFPAHYVGLATMSGTNEVWFIQPTPSFAVAEEWDKAGDKEPLKTTLGMLDARDGELRSSSRTMWAVYRPDISYRPEKFNHAKVRYVDVGTFRVKLGHGADFAAAAKLVFGGYEKANVDDCILAYQVTAGAPSGTYLFFSVMDSLKSLDDAPAHSQAMRQALGQDTYSQLMKTEGDVIASIEDTLLEVRPGMSYATQDMIDADPAFWKPKPAPKPVPATAPAEKKGAN